MSDIFKASRQTPKRDWFDWACDHVGIVILASIVCNVIFWGGLAFFIVSQSHHIAHLAGSIARDAADGFNQAAKPGAKP